VTYALPIVFALFLWWFSTGVIFYLDSRPAKTFKWSMLAGTAIFAIAIYGLWDTAGRATTAGAYCAFACGLIAWGWHEMSLYMGFVTGPRKHRCQAGCSGLAHFGHAIEANLWHELAIIATAILFVALTWNGANHIGLWTFLLLWWMHLSARLNVFLGVRNVSEEFVPAHMDVLKGFLTKKPMNLLFPFSVTATSVGAAVLFLEAAEATSAFAVTGLALLGTIMVLAVIEHWFLMLPLPVERLWRWSLASREAEKHAAKSADFKIFETVRAG
jgi:putative photosynthetic complex assembly protein 2